MSEIKGISGELRVGYQQAAQLKDWIIKEGVCRATIVRSNEYWLNQYDEFTLCVEVGVNIWKWRNVTIEQDGKQITAIVSGQPEIRREGK